MSKTIIKQNNKDIYKKVGSPVAKSLWGFKHQTFKDKTKYTRKRKYKDNYENT